MSNDLALHVSEVCEDFMALNLSVLIGLQKCVERGPAPPRCL